MKRTIGTQFSVRRVLPYLAMTGLISLQANAQTGRLTGYVKGLGNQLVVFGYQQGGSYRLVTVHATDDRFVYQPKPSDDGQVHLRISRPRYASFWYEPGEVTVSGVVEQPHRLVIKGGPENNVLNQYNQSIEWFYEDKKREKPDSVTVLEERERRDILRFIRQHPLARTSAHLLYWQTLYHEGFIEEYRKLLKSLSPAVQTSPQGKQAAQRIKNLENQPIVGRKAPSFALPDTAGNVISLATYQGSYVLLDFWGHWCGPCLAAFPTLKKLREQYANKLVIIGIAAERAEHKPQWLLAVRANNLNWVQLSELKADQGEVNNQYNIAAFPTYFLLDKKGIVLERANSIEKIEQKLTSLGGL